jgi:hypothetical protein
MKNSRYLIIFIFIIFFLNILYSQEIFFSNFDQNHLQELNLKILEKDYLEREEVFKNYLLHFPKIDFNLSKNQDSNSNYNNVVLKYSHLPFLEEKKFIFCDFNLDYKVFNNFEKYIFSSTNNQKECIYLKLKYIDKTEEFVFINIYIKDTPLIDFVREKDILRSEKQLKELNGYLYYDQNISYLIDYNNYFLFNKSPYEIKKIIPIFVPEEVVVKKEKNYFFLFVLVLLILFLFYDIFYFNSKYIKKTYPYIKKINIKLKKEIIYLKNKLFKQ